MALEHFWQGMDLHERERVLLSADETSVRLVPGEGVGMLVRKLTGSSWKGFPSGAGRP